MLEIGLDSSLLTSSSDLLSAVCAIAIGICRKQAHARRASDLLNRFSTTPPIHEVSRLSWQASRSSSRETAGSAHSTPSWSRARDLEPFSELRLALQVSRPC